MSFSCENHRNDSDMRQIMAKNSIEEKLHKVRAFNVTSFNEDTVSNVSDPNFKTQIRYSLGIEYKDFNNVFQQKQAIVMFTPDGQTIINSSIIDK